MPASQHNWIVFGCGFLQRQGEADQGIPHMAADFEERFQGKARVELRRWDDDWSDLSEWIFRRASRISDIRLLCICYSWGGGFGFRKFASSCKDRGIKISGAVLSDAVYHFNGRLSHKIGLAQVAAFWPPPAWKQVCIPKFTRPFYACKKLMRPKLWLPENINKENTWWYVQENSWLRGHDIYWNDTREIAANKTVIPFKVHTYMDEDETFYDKAMEVATMMFDPPPEIPGLPVPGVPGLTTSSS